jgi:hypothetical protein
MKLGTKRKPRKKIQHPRPGQLIADAEPSQFHDVSRSLLQTPEFMAALALCLIYSALASGHLYSIDGLLMYLQATSLSFSIRSSSHIPSCGVASAGPQVRTAWGFPFSIYRVY